MCIWPGQIESDNFVLQHQCCRYTVRITHTYIIYVRVYLLSYIMHVCTAHTHTHTRSYFQPKHTHAHTPTHTRTRIHYYLSTVIVWRYYDPEKYFVYNIHSYNIIFRERIECIEVIILLHGSLDEFIMD